MKKIAVFASGGGTDFQSVIDANEREQFCTIEYLVASKPEIGAIKRAEKHGIKVLTFDKTVETKAEFYTRIAETLKGAGIEYIVLAGWLLVVPADFIKVFENAIINIHPSLIPSFCGKGYYGLKVHEAALAYGVKVTGATVHFVNEIPDGGQIILQKAVYIEEGDTPEVLQQRVMQQAEWLILPQATEMISAQIKAAKENE